LKALLDATAIVALLLNPPQRLDGLSELFTLDLAFYEVGNAIWKAAKVHRSFNEEKGAKAVRTLEKLMENMNVLPFREVEASKVFEVGVRSGLTFYDSSYLVTALGKGLTLITDDKKLARVAEEEGIEVFGSDMLPTLLGP